MNRDSIIGFVLIAAILVVYSFWMTPSQEELDARQRKIDSVAQVRQQQQLLSSVRLTRLARLAEEVKQQQSGSRSSSCFSCFRWRQPLPIPAKQGKIWCFCTCHTR